MPGLMDGESVTTAIQSCARRQQTLQHRSKDFWCKNGEVRAEVIVGVPLAAVWSGDHARFGGVFVEAIGRVEFLLPPFDEHDVERMIERTGIGKVLRARGAAFEADVDAVCSAVLALGDLATSDLGIGQIEINPLVVLPDDGGVAAVDALVLLSPEVKLD